MSFEIFTVNFEPEVQEPKLMANQPTPMVDEPSFGGGTLGGSIDQSWQALQPQSLVDINVMGENRQISIKSYPRMGLMSLAPRKSRCSTEVSGSNYNASESNTFLGCPKCQMFEE